MPVEVFRKSAPAPRACSPARRTASRAAERAGLEDRLEPDAVADRGARRGDGARDRGLVAREERPPGDDDVDLGRAGLDRLARLARGEVRVVLAGGEVRDRGDGDAGAEDPLDPLGVDADRGDAARAGDRLGGERVDRPGVVGALEPANIRKELGLLLKNMDEADSVVVALAGHGVQFRGDEESYFCPADARLADQATLIPLGEVYTALEALRRRAQAAAGRRLPQRPADGELALAGGRWSTWRA